MSKPTIMFLFLHFSICGIYYVTQINFKHDVRATNRNAHFESPFTGYKLYY